MAGKKRPAEELADAEEGSIDTGTSTSGSADEYPEVECQDTLCNAVKL